jgi:uncharacterized membrane protein
MTAVTHRPLYDSTDALLRFAMRADATLCAAIGLFIAFAADPLAHLTGLSATAEWLVGAGLVGYGVALYVLAALDHLRRVGRVLVATNSVCSVAVVVAAPLLPLTGFGVGLALAFAALTAALAWLQHLGVRRLA